MSESPTPPPTPADRQHVPDSMVPDAEGTVVASRARVVRLQKKAPVDIPVPLPGTMGDAMTTFVSHYEYPIAPELSEALIHHYSQIGRAARRLQTLREQRPLNAQAEETMRYLRSGLGGDFINRVTAHATELETRVARIMKGICEGEGVGYTVDQWGVYNEPFAAEMEALLALLEKGWQEVNPALAHFSPYYAQIDERDNPAQLLTDFLANAAFMRRFQEQPAVALMELQIKLTPFGLESDSASLVSIRNLGKDLPETVIVDQVNELVQPRVEKLMHEAFRQKLSGLMDLPPKRRIPGMQDLEFLFLTLLKFSLYNRHRTLVKRNLHLLQNPAGAKKGRGLDNFNPSLAGVRELYKLLHQVIHFSGSEAQLKTYLSSNH